MRIVSYRIFMD